MDGYCDRLSPVSLGSLRSLRKKKINDHIWKPLSSNRSENDHREIQLFVYISAIVVAAIAGEWFPYDRYDRCDC